MTTSLPKFMKNKNSSGLEPKKQYHQLRALWMLRILVHTDAFNDFFSRDDFEEEKIMGFMGLKAIKRQKCSKKTILNKRQSRFKQEKMSPTAILEILEKECSLKTDFSQKQTKIGFS